MNLIRKSNLGLKSDPIAEKGKWSVSKVHTKHVSKWIESQSCVREVNCCFLKMKLSSAIFKMRPQPCAYRWETKRWGGGSGLEPANANLPKPSATQRRPERVICPVIRLSSDVICLSVCRLLSSVVICLSSDVIWLSVCLFVSEVSE